MSLFKVARSFQSLLLTLFLHIRKYASLSKFANMPPCKNVQICLIVKWRFAPIHKGLYAHPHMGEICRQTALAYMQAALNSEYAHYNQTQYLSNILHTKCEYTCNYLKIYPNSMDIC